MKRYVAFLRGVSPVNAKMPELKRAFEVAGFADVQTVLASGNVVFSVREASVRALERKAESSMKSHLGKSFLTLVRSVEALQKILASDPYRGLKMKPETKRVVTFLRDRPREVPRLPLDKDGAVILRLVDREVYSAYVPTTRGPVFMALIERTFGKDVTTRTWDTVRRVAFQAP